MTSLYKDIIKYNKIKLLISTQILIFNKFKKNTNNFIIYNYKITNNYNNTNNNITIHLINNNYYK